MSDATNSNKRDLWLYDDGSWREGFHDDGKVSPLLHYIARPAADDEALLRAFEALLRAFEALLRAFEALLRALLKSSLDAGAWKARAERAEAALADAVKAERARIAKHLRDIGLAGPAKDVERCPSCYDLGVVGAGDEPCRAVACDAHAAKMREDAARQGGTDGR